MGQLKKVAQYKYTNGTRQVIAATLGSIYSGH